MSGFLVKKELWSIWKNSILYFSESSLESLALVIKATFCRRKLNSSAKTTKGNDRKLGGKSYTYLLSHHFALGQWNTMTIGEIMNILNKFAQIVPKLRNINQR